MVSTKYKSRVTRVCQYDIKQITRLIPFIWHFEIDIMSWANFTNRLIIGCWFWERRGMIRKDKENVNPNIDMVCDKMKGKEKIGRWIDDKEEDDVWED